MRDDKIHQIYGTMQAGQDKYGMQTMNQSLARLVERRVITNETALAATSNKDELAMMIAPTAPTVATARRPVMGASRPETEARK
jgi:twitching motility protein PilT